MQLDRRMVKDRVKAVLWCEDRVNQLLRWIRRGLLGRSSDDAEVVAEESELVLQEIPTTEAQKARAPKKKSDCVLLGFRLQVGMIAELDKERELVKATAGFTPSRAEVLHTLVTEALAKRKADRAHTVCEACMTEARVYAAACFFDGAHERFDDV